jgi:hypothetical protein
VSIGSAIILAIYLQLWAFLVGGLILLWLKVFFFGRRENIPFEYVGVFQRVKDKENNNREMVFSEQPHEDADYLKELFSENKANHNLLVVGYSGGGKSLLLVAFVEDAHKRFGKNNFVIFSPKFFDEDESIDFELPFLTVVDCKKNMINPFEDIPSFISSWEVHANNKMSMQGITASQIGSMAGEIARLHPCKTWSDFGRNAEELKLDAINSGSMISMGQINWILTELPNLSVEITTDEIPTKNVIFYLGSLNKTSRAYYYELFLQKLDRELNSKKLIEKPILVLDEIHIVARKEVGGLSSIMRELRTRVEAVWGGSQNLNDIAPELLMFEGIPAFQTHNLKPFSEKPTLEECIGKLADKDVNKKLPYRFIDYADTRSNDVYVLRVKPEYAQKIKELKLQALKKRLENTVKESEQKSDDKVSEEVRTETDEDVVSKIISILENSEICLTAHGITSGLGYSKTDSRRRNLQLRVLPELLKNDKIRKIDYVTARLKPEQKARKYFYSIPKGESQVHHTLVVDALDVLEKISVLASEGQTNQGWDIHCTEQNFHIDSKSGLEHDLKSDITRLRDENITPKGSIVIFVCANYEIRQRYSDAFSVVEEIQGRYRICCLNELADIIRGLKK